jgi:adenine deaminase
MVATDAAVLAARIAQGRAAKSADLVIKGVRLFDLVTGALLPTDIAICGRTIVGTLGSIAAP